MKITLFLAFSMWFQTTLVAQNELPPNPLPGKCYAKVFKANKNAPQRSILNNDGSRTPMGKADIVWDEVVCGSKISRKIIERLAVALQERGFYNAESKTPKTFTASLKAALTAWQKSEGLNYNQLTETSAQILGLFNKPKKKKR